MNQKYMWTQQELPRVWNKGSDVNPHTRAVLRALQHFPKCTKITLISYCVVTRWVLIKIESQLHPMKAANILISNMIHHINPSFFIINLWQLKHSDYSFLLTNPSFDLLIIHSFWAYINLTVYICLSNQSWIHLFQHYSNSFIILTVMLVIMRAIITIYSLTLPKWVVK